MAKAPKSDAGSGELPAEIVALSFEDALRELEDIVDRLESGNVNLDESIDIYTRGTHLKRHCEAKLGDARARIDRIIPDGNGGVGTEPLDVD
jgi:exodeoxyribonuclease VII small subunit